MKLKNKKTGEIIEFDAILPVKDVVGDSVAFLEYGSLAELNEEWEDYEEPKTQFYITAWGDIREYTTEEERFAFKQKLEIGNYFETREEAEKAVERLRAWKRLKDKGFKFVGRSIKDLTITYSFDNYDEPDIPQMNADLDICFGGEE